MKNPSVSFPIQRINFDWTAAKRFRAKFVNDILLDQFPILKKNIFGMENLY